MEFGRVDILVNSAGRTKREPTVDQSEEDWNAILETNLNGTLRSCQVFGRHMVANGYGRIINIASLSSFVGLYHVAGYAASKAAVASLTKSLAVEWARHGITVNAIAPGYFRTDINKHALDDVKIGPKIVGHIPLRRVGQPEELGPLVVYLASDAAAYMTGSVLVIDGGQLAR